VKENRQKKKRFCYYADRRHSEARSFMWEDSRNLSVF